jgi:hypothetical protein
MTKETEKNGKSKMSSSDFMFEVIGWIQIVFSPLLLAGIIGFIIYVSNPTATRLVVGIIVSFIGLIIGIVFANRVWKKHGTMHFVSRVSASPELDNTEE